jgi:ribosomal protein S18 acetylase RimI-like enzyme
MIYRRYVSGDQAACLAIFASNAAVYFSPGDHDAFQRFLLAPAGFYGVLCDDAGRIVGCGGVAIDAFTQTAVLTWGMIDASLHGRGLGRLLLQERMRIVGQHAGVSRIKLHTCQLTLGFYEKAGFRLIERVIDGYRPGLDRCRMELVM